MLQNVTLAPSRRSLEFGIYRDGDNNLDAIQESPLLGQALRTSQTDSRIEFTVEDTTALQRRPDKFRMTPIFERSIRLRTGRSATRTSAKSTT